MCTWVSYSYSTPRFQVKSPPPFLPSVNKRQTLNTINASSFHTPITHTFSLKPENRDSHEFQFLSFLVLTEAS